MPDNSTADAAAVAEETRALPRPDLYIQANDEKRVKMTYGLLMDLQRLLPDATQALQLVMTDPYTQDYVVRRVMTDFKGTVTKIEELADPKDIDLSPEDVERILDWVVQHILHFFAQRAGNMAATGKAFQTALPSLFTSGSPNSAGTTQSAGPSESPKTA